MPWTKKTYPNSMKNLQKQIREKAIDIANELVQDGYEDERAIPIAITRAKKWYENRGGTVVSEVTHRLVPEKEGWILKKVDENTGTYFDTKQEAMEKIEGLAKKEPIKVMIHDAQGKFQDVY